MIEKIKNIEKPRISIIFFCLSFFSIFFNASKYHSLLYALPFYALFCITEYIEYYKNYKKFKPIKVGVMELLLILFGIFAILSAIFVEFSFTSVKVTCYYIGAIITILVLKNANLEKKDIRFIINAYILSTVLIVVKMLFQQVTRSGEAFRYSIAFLGQVQDTNFLAAYMSFPTIILAFKTICEKKNRVWNLILFAFCAGGIFFTGSRAALIGLTIAIAMLIIYAIYTKMKTSNIKIKKYIPRILLIIAIIICILAVLLSFIPDVFINRYFKASYVDGSNIARFHAWKAGMNIFAHHPIFGQGVESQLRLGMQYGMKYHMYTHSTYVDLLADYGLIGALTLGLFICILGYKNIKIKRWPILALLVNTIFTSAIISSLYVAYFWQNLIIIYLLTIYAKNNLHNQYDVLRSK